MPCIFQNATTDSGVQRRLNQPLPHADIILPIALVHFLPRQGKLATAGRADHLGQLKAGQELHERIGESHGGRVAGVTGTIAKVARGLEFGGTADHPRAAQVDVARFTHVVGVQVSDGNGRVVEGVIVVPLIAAAVQEDDDIGESPVAIDNIPVALFKKGLVVLRISIFGDQRSAGGGSKAHVK